MNLNINCQDINKHTVHLCLFVCCSLRVCAASPEPADSGVWSKTDIPTWTGELLSVHARHSGGT